MLSLLSNDCQALNRREFLRLGSLAAGGVSLVDVLRQRAGANNPMTGGVGDPNSFDASFRNAGTAGLTRGTSGSP